jgi:ATP-dependent helicase Lhr and Lhr-like helicase
VPLSSFSPPVQEWFAHAFAAPTPAQAKAWPAIARGEHVLLSAPTGSGKTLAAFLWALDRLSRDQATDRSSRSARRDDGSSDRGRTLPRTRPAPRRAHSMVGRSRFGVRRTGAQSQVQGRWSLTEPVFRGGSVEPSETERRRTLAELLLERYGIVTREQVLAEGVRGGFATLYGTFCNLETLGVCRRGYFIEGMGGAQFALPGAVERLRASRAGAGDGLRGRALVIAAADPAQPYGAALAWPRHQVGEQRQRRPARVAGAYVVIVEDEPVLYVERGGRGLVTLAGKTSSGGVAGGGLPGGGAGELARRCAGGIAGASAAAAHRPLHEALRALAEAVRGGRVPKLALERIDGEPAIASDLAQALVELGFHSGPRRLTLTA